MFYYHYIIIIIIRPHRSDSVLLLHKEWRGRSVCLSVCLSVRHVPETCEYDRTDCDAVGGEGVESGGP